MFGFIFKQMRRFRLLRLPSCEVGFRGKAYAMAFLNRRVILLSFLVVQIFLSLPLLPVWSQSEKSEMIDISAPEIQHNASFKPKAAGLALTVKALVSDDRAVSEVIFYYRSKDAKKYSKIRMRPVGSDSYSITIPKEKVFGLKVEYYIQAFDKEGNISLQGNAEVPLTITLELKATSEKRPWYKKLGDWAWKRGSGTVQNTVSTVEDIFK